MTPVMLKGKSPFSAFRMAALLQRVRQADPGREIGGIDVATVYFLDAADPPRGDACGKVWSLLDAEGEFTDGTGFLVTPRKGTVSPWSSKATDIFRNCGLAAIARVERGLHYRVQASDGRVLAPGELGPALALFFDRMTEGVYTDLSDLFRQVEPAPMQEIDLLGIGRTAVEKANVDLGLALNPDEIGYLCDAYRAMARNPTDVELVMFGQVNSEHCRHKIFHADWVLDGRAADRTLFGMIRHTHERHPGGTLVAYEDNAGVLEGFDTEWFEAGARDGNRYGYARRKMDLVMKVETHNHPTAISPDPGAATGVGGEIRDESATGVGGKSKAGLSAFLVSNLRIPDFVMPWERETAEFPVRLATPLEIMTEGPIGGAMYGNEFGRPQLTGLFRTCEVAYNGRLRGYHKPIMVAGGMGNIKREHVHKREIPPGALIVQLGGPALRIGLGGGAASSMAAGSNVAELDYDSVQRANAEMERRCQGVIEACSALGEKNPVLSIHDLGAGGLSNGCPELVAQSGATFRLRKVPNQDLSMSPMEIWCCEAQERYVLAVAPESADLLLGLCARERCPAAVIGEATGDGRLMLEDEHFGNRPIDMDIGVLLGRPPKMLREAQRRAEDHAPADQTGIETAEAVQRVLRLPAVANKTFLITIADRSVTGMVARDQMVGPYQTPISDAAVTATSYRSVTGEAMAMGERTLLALVSAPASGRMAVGEALTNIACADIGAIGQVKLSANWMCACGEEGEDANLFDTVRAVGLELCPKLGISIPVGKDSLSMRTIWRTSDGGERKMTAPLSLIVSAFAPVRDIRKTITPDLKPGNSCLILIDLGRGRNRLGGSALMQVYNRVGGDVPDLDDPDVVAPFFAAMAELVETERLLAYHDRSDGGLFVTLAEMAFGGRRGLKADLAGLGADPVAALFAEELGAVLQVREADRAAVQRVLAKHGLESVSHAIGAPADDGRLEIVSGNEPLFCERVSTLNRAWSELTYRMQSWRDHPACAREEYDGLLEEADPGMTVELGFEPREEPPSVTAARRRPRMAVLREQGVNGHVEMAAAFDRAGFASVDVHMTDLLSGRMNLDAFVGLVACGGFSYGDVLGAGSGWAKSVLFNPALQEMFRRFFERPETFALGVCNGCQMLSQLKDIIPGAADWPRFTRNRSEQFEARYVTVEVRPSPSVLLRGMEASRLPIPVAHGEGFADFEATGSAAGAAEKGLVALRFVDHAGRPTERYPLNPNGSPGGVTGLTSEDGRVTVMMPHPERGFRSVQMSYRPPDLFTGEAGPWLRMFQNAREFVR